MPLSGFYEWKRESKSKRPFAIHLRDQSIMSVAGVWEHWQPDDNTEPVHSFSIVTTRANTFIADIHNRMPVILDGQDVEHWPSGSFTPPRCGLFLLRRSHTQRHRAVKVVLCGAFWVVSMVTSESGRSDNRCSKYTIASTSQETPPAEAARRTSLWCTPASRHAISGR